MEREIILAFICLIVYFIQCTSTITFWHFSTTWVLSFKFFDIHKYNENRRE